MNNLFYQLAVWYTIKYSFETKFQKVEYILYSPNSGNTHSPMNSVTFQGKKNSKKENVSSYLGMR